MYTQWKALLGSPDAFSLDLPSEVVEVKWDLILVDAPDGWQKTSPGRMQSIAIASQLVNIGGDVFVHDCDRQIENEYSTKYLRNENFLRDIDRLRHFNVVVDPNASELQR